MSLFFKNLKQLSSEVSAVFEQKDLTIKKFIAGYYKALKDADQRMNSEYGDDTGKEKSRAE